MKLKTESQEIPSGVEIDEQHLESSIKHLQEEKHLHETNASSLQFENDELKLVINKLKTENSQLMTKNGDLITENTKFKSQITENLDLDSPQKEETHLLESHYQKEIKMLQLELEQLTAELQKITISQHKTVSKYVS